jgi:sRNA-binding regulator protein Hfq
MSFGEQGRAERSRQMQGNAGTVKPRSKGHDSVLNAIQEQGRQMTVILLSGEEVAGKLVGRDKFTVTLRVPLGHTTRREVIYKSAIERFWADETPATEG